MATIDRDRLPKSVFSLTLRNESALLVQARTVTHTEVARRVNLPKQTYQDWRDDHMKDALAILAAYGLKIVPHDTEAYGSEDIAAMQHLAMKGVLAMRPLVKLGASVEEVDIAVGDTRPGDL
jgi:hypothetical protein